MVLTVFIFVSGREGLGAVGTEVGLVLNSGFESSFSVLGHVATGCQAVSSVSGLGIIFAVAATSETRPVEQADNIRATGRARGFLSSGDTEGLNVTERAGVEV